jgi:hypothetical protein
MKRFLIGLAAAAGLTLGLAATAEARTNFDFYIGTPFPSYGYAPGYGQDYGFYDEPRYYPRRHFRHRGYQQDYGFYAAPRHRHRWQRRHHRDRYWN